MLEKEIEAYLVKCVSALGGMAIKQIGLTGMTDRLVVLPGGKVTFIELKRPGGKPRKIQVHIMNELEKLGCDVLVIDSKDKVDEFIKTA